MRLPRYEDAPLVDASGWVEDELFWPAFLYCVGLAQGAPEAFDVDLGDLEAYLENFEDPGQWPVFAVAVAGGTLHLVVCTMPDDAGIDWVVDEGVRAADPGPHYTDDHGLPWPLLPSDPASLLLALPAFGNPDVPEPVRAAVSHALRSVGAAKMLNELADDLLTHRACLLM
ncbi:hypothetical protein [Paractinoplanes atraurantiacus]|uniref:Uncharacterized protein n=1 Tax=Paractinoplanes atraurantiacus TaxID=1036182 RepID=A0A285J7Z5_9ACTN|nr:hypothetical protein [Actinoplanes atraurantiacus]SNY56342.1 hypothetical protein SAMN05421748_117135 [Actinoplanes atraurantiacus]